jgi:hypothetical protein
MDQFLIIMLFSWAPWLTLGGGCLYLGLRYVRAQEARAGDRTEMAALTERVLSLEESILDIVANRDRAIESQQFAAQLLIKRSAGEKE